MSNINLLGRSLSEYFIDYTNPAEKPVIDPETQKPVIENGQEKTVTVYETVLPSLSLDNFDKALDHFRVSSDPNGMRAHLFETLDLNGDSALTQEEMQRGIQILIDLAGKTGMTQGLTADDWSALKGAGGALQYVYDRQFAGVTLLALFRRTGDTSNIKAYFQITKPEFTDLMDKVGLFKGWDPKKGLLQNRQYAIDYLWSLLSETTGGAKVIDSTADMGMSIFNEVIEKTNPLSAERHPRYQEFFEQYGSGLTDSKLTADELEGVCKALLREVFDSFMLQFYRDQQKIYQRFSDAIKEMNR